MNAAEFFIDLDRIRKIVESWDNSSNISALERDLVLDKLKSLYERVLFGQAVTNNIEEESIVIDPIDLSIGMTELIDLSFDEQQTDDIEDEAVAEPAIEPEDETMAEPEEIETEAETVVELVVEPETETEIEIVAEIETITEQEQVPEPEIEILPEPEVMQESIIIDTPEPEVFIIESKPIAVPEPVEVMDQSLFAADSIPTKPKIDRRVILSLYGDEPMQEQHMPEPVAIKEKPRAEEKPQDIPQLTTVDKPHTAVLGDVIGKGGHTVGDNIFTVVDRVDVATKVVTNQSTSLRKMIGINDKFQMIRDLFNGDAIAYEQAIDALEAFGDMDDALIYIHETYSWNPNSEGVKLLIELLTRKLS